MTESIAAIHWPDEDGRSGQTRASALPRRSSTPILLPLFHRPSHVKVFTPDAELERLLRTSTKVNFASRVHSDVNNFLDELQQEPPLAENELWLQRRLLDSVSERGLLPQVLKLWRALGARPNLARVCVIDGAMDVLPDLLDWDGYRILIASHVTDEKAAELIAEGQVHQILRRTQFGWKEQLLTRIGRQIEKPWSPAQHLWATQLNREQIQVLRNPVIAHELATLTSERWVEWVCLGQPFGILGRSASDEIEWLQLQLTAQVDLAILQGEELGFNDADLSAIAGCRSLVDQDLRRALAQPSASAAVPAFHIGEDGLLIGAWRPVRKPHGNRPLKRAERGSVEALFGHAPEHQGTLRGAA